MGFQDFFINNFDFKSFITSLLGGFVAFISTSIKNYILSPKLDIEMNIEDENLFKTCTTGNDTLYSLKLKISNIGKKTANNVQVIIDKVNCNDNIAENLLFSYQDYSIENNLPILISKNISSKNDVHCDFLYIFCDPSTKEIKQTKFATLVQQHSFFNQSEKYEVYISLSGDNVQTKKYKISFSYDANSLEKKLIISNLNIES